MGIISKIYILHGWTYSTEKWNPFINLVKKNRLESHMLNVPGLTEKTDKIWNFEDYVEWLNEILKKEDNKVILIGHSNGGRIALNFAIKYPQKLAHLVLIDSAGIYHNELSIIIKKLVFKNIAKIGKKLISSKSLRNILYKVVGENDYKTARPVMRQTMINLIDSDKFLSPDKVEVPTLIIWGREDKITPLNDGKIMHKLIRNSKLYVVKGAKHSPHFTHTKEVADVILQYLKSQMSNVKSTSVNLKTIITKKF